MRVAIETSLTSTKHTTGIGTYVQGLVRGLQKAPVQLEVWDPAGQWGYRIPGAWVRPGALRKLLYFGWLNLVFPGLARRHEIDVAHFTNFIPPLSRIGKACPYVITVHDINVLRYPGYNRLYRLYRRTLLSRAVRVADAIIVPSNHAKRDVCTFLHVPEGKVHVVYHGVSTEFVLDRNQLLEMKDRKFILSVGPLSIRKNHAALIAAYGMVLSEKPDFPYDLVITGDLRDKASEQLGDAVSSAGVGDRVRFVGHVDRTELQRFYREAVLFAFPSQYEGFGLPCLEAMGAGTPVVAFRATSIPEVVGDAGVLVEPGDIEGMAKALLEVSSDPRLWSRYSAAGLKRVQRFSWDETARETLKVYEKVSGRSA